MKFQSSMILLVVACLMTTTTTEAFSNTAALPSSTRLSSTTTTSLSATPPNNPNSRRAFFTTSMMGMATALVATPPQEAEATYTAYTQREQDWQARMDKGDVKVSSARDLRKQLAEIVPQNSEGAKIFCPNGPSAAVSPLMENKCGDRMAIPSVYGRTQDSVGNSIPGFSGGYYGNGATSAIASNPNVGGFPTYNTNLKK
jgi:hypothetical protein